ncbi:Rrf2 family transcriptional regulator [Pseudaminobacter arsenicus]|uniref:Rrf2 family transcriptional regulator n=2 Tax=Borborobacter arsenicus TaxID=1851146 RepID=A0A432V784_9HYPH|nr:Rrf2 family transcriptional regulator [Pseudaminobacter arsenicus]RUM98036.1 Rrf2 family transcriptional regulator [Pseudaminobacter arsenicus]
MRMSLQTDYALRMLIYLALRKEESSTVSEVAARYGLSHNHLLKVALHLKNLGLVKTTRGRSGGIRLACEPQQIGIGMLVRSMGSDFALVECMKADGGACILTPACRLKTIICEALDAYLSVFDKYTLADLLTNANDLRTILGIDQETAAEQSAA